MKPENRHLLRRAFVATLPVMAGYVVLGTGFGILFQSKGYALLWAAAMSLFVYAGSMQYLAVDLLTGGVSLIAAAVTTLMVNARHLFYGISMIGKYQNTGPYKPYLIFGLTDETYSLNCVDLPNDITNAPLYYFLVTILDQSYWVLGTVMGSLLGQIIPFSTEGIDFSLTALFITVFVEQWKSTKDHVPAIIGLAASVVCLLIFGTGNFLIPTMILITLCLTIYRKTEGGKRHG